VMKNKIFTARDKQLSRTQVRICNISTRSDFSHHFFVQTLLIAIVERANRTFTSKVLIYGTPHYDGSYRLK
jgi:hypothetical protein